MIQKEQILPMIKEIFPSFETDEEDLLYLALGDFADYVLDLYQKRKTDDFPRLFKLIEDFIVQGDYDVRGYIIIGLLEDVQNLLLGRKIPLETFSAFLLPESLKHWNNVIAFWNGEPYI